MDRRLALDNGRRVKTVEPNGTITHYPFPFYEVENPGQPSEIKRTTYSLGGQAIALRVVGGSSPGLYYVHADHLGSTQRLSTSSGSPVLGSDARYLPFGKYRVTPTAGLTDRGFTGHLHNDPIGLVYMNARYYVPSIGRFASADTIVPDSKNPQTFNRYAYANNNPLLYVDPSGHSACSDTECDEWEFDEDYVFNRVRDIALAYYRRYFADPFDGNPRVVRDVDPTHNGVDYEGQINVRAPAGGTVTEAGQDAPAGMWRIGKDPIFDEEGNITGYNTIREWSIFDTATEGRNSRLTIYDRDENGLVEPQRLLADPVGGWVDLAPGWSHTRGTVMEISHGHFLETRYYHTDPAVVKGTTVDQGAYLGSTANTGYSTGTHLHYTVAFVCKGRTEILNPLNR